MHSNNVRTRFFHLMKTLKWHLLEERSFTAAVSKAEGAAPRKEKRIPLRRRSCRTKKLAGELRCRSGNLWQPSSHSLHRVHVTQDGGSGPRNYARRRIDGLTRAQKCLCFCRQPFPFNHLAPSNPATPPLNRDFPPFIGIWMRHSSATQ
jgi:hypothetical protein